MFDDLKVFVGFRDDGGILIVRRERAQLGQTE